MDPRSNHLRARALAPDHRVVGFFCYAPIFIRLPDELYLDARRDKLPNGPDADP